MDFFNFLRNNQPADSNNGETPADDTVVIFSGASPRISVPAEEARSSTVRELFNRYAEDLGVDPSTITRFVNEGVQVSSDAVPQLGYVYQGTSNSDEKG